VLAIGLALAASVSWGVGDFLGGTSSRRVSAITVLAISEVAGLALAALVVPASREPWPGSAALWAVAAGIAGTLGLGALYRGMAVGAIGVVAPVSSAAAVIPVAVGIATGDRPSGLQLGGAACALVGVVLASRERIEGRVRLAAGVKLALLAAAGFGLYFVFIDHAADGGAVWAATISRATASVAAVGAALALGRMRAPRRLLPVLVLVGCFDVGANILLALALRSGLISLVSVLASLYPIVTIALARATLGERPQRLQQVGIALALTGAALIAAG
jgi:drug/metabolite transporter (DMT)-like permease